MTATATSPERAMLVEAALRSSKPVAFLRGLQATFLYAGREEDFSTVAMLCELFERDEIEQLLYLRKQWKRSSANHA